MRAAKPATLVRWTLAVASISVLAWVYSMQTRYLYRPFSLAEKLIVFAITTAFVLGVSFPRSRRLWHRVLFWVVVCPVLIAFLVMQWELINSVRISDSLIAVIVLPETVILLLLFDRLAWHLRQHRQKVAVFSEVRGAPASNVSNEAKDPVDTKSQTASY
jgi:hypothetical protein